MPRPRRDANPLERKIKDIETYIRDLSKMAKEDLEIGQRDLQDTLFDMETDAGGLLKVIGEALTILEEHEG